MYGVAFKGSGRCGNVGLTLSTQDLEDHQENKRDGGQARGIANVILAY
jgi:hypothetical protein